MYLALAAHRVQLSCPTTSPTSDHQSLQNNSLSGLESSQPFGSQCTVVVGGRQFRFVMRWTSVLEDQTKRPTIVRRLGRTLLVSSVGSSCWPWDRGGQRRSDHRWQPHSLTITSTAVSGGGVVLCIRYCASEELRSPGRRSISNRPSPVSSFFYLPLHQLHTMSVPEPRWEQRPLQWGAINAYTRYVSSLLKSAWLSAQVGVHRPLLGSELLIDQTMRLQDG